MDLEQRDSIRRTVRQGARSASTEGSVLGTCMMVDVSATGARLLLEKPDPLPKQFFLRCPTTEICACSVAWKTGTTVVIQFIPS